jgi:hypothetical protein
MPWIERQQEELEGNNRKRRKGLVAISRKGPLFLKRGADARLRH